MQKMPVPIGGYKLPSGRLKMEAPESTKDSGTKKTGTFKGKPNALGHGGRAAQLRAKGVPEGVIGSIARSKGAASGQANYHGAKK